MKWEAAGTTLLFLAVLAVAVTGCDANPHSASSTTGTVPPTPVVTDYREDFSISWEPADDVAQVRTIASEDLAAQKATALVPTSLPSGATNSSGQLRISRTIPTGYVAVDIAIRFTMDQMAQLLSLETRQIRPDVETCTDRVNAGSTVTTLQVRSSLGCVTTDATGTTFILWDDGTYVYTVETRIDPALVVRWIDDWVSIP
jgi:hypothetical protein